MYDFYIRWQASAEYEQVKGYLILHTEKLGFACNQPKTDQPVDYLLLRCPEPYGSGLGLHLTSYMIEHERCFSAPPS